MDNEELKHLHRVLLVIMDEINRICEKNDIIYTLWAGSMIGAVRHKGFIPWDDDLDIAMSRKNYERFLRACEVDLDQRFSVVSMDTKDIYGYGFCKVVLKNTNVEQFGVKNGKNLEIWLDIFPYDDIPDSTLLRKKQNAVNYFLMKVLEERFDGIVGEAGIAKKICFGIFHIINLFIPSNVLKKLLQHNMTKYNGKGYLDCSSISSPYGYYKEILGKKELTDVVEYSFENRKYLGFANYDYYLTKIYGDYMKIPPENKRHIHNIKVHDFANY